MLLDSTTRSPLTDCLSNVPREAVSQQWLREDRRGDQCPEAAFSSPLTSQGMSILCTLI